MLKLKLLLILVAIISLTSSDSTVGLQTGYESAIAAFIEDSIKIDLSSVEKFTIKPSSNNEKFNVQIESGRKKIKIVLSRLFTVSSSPQFKILFMEQIARFGSEKSFLNIRTSRGRNQDVVVNKEKSKQEVEKKEVKQEYGKINNHAALGSEMNKFENIYMKRVKQFILNQFPLANSKTLKLLQSSDPSEYKIEMQMKNAVYLLTISKELQNSQQKLKVRDLIKLQSQ